MSHGEATWCVVSGAVIEIEASTPKLQVGDQTLYFCCQSCVDYFGKHREEVLKRRGIKS